MKKVSKVLFFAAACSYCFPLPAISADKDKPAQPTTTLAKSPNTSLSAQPLVQPQPASAQREARRPPRQPVVRWPKTGKDTGRGFDEDNNDFSGVNPGHWNDDND